MIVASRIGIPKVDITAMAEYTFVKVLVISTNADSTGKQRKLKKGSMMLAICFKYPVWFRISTKKVTGMVILRSHKVVFAALGKAGFTQFNKRFPKEVLFILFELNLIQ